MGKIQLQKLFVLREDGFDVDQHRVKMTVVKTFKRTPDALAFINDEKNLREYGYLQLIARDKDGLRWEWSELDERWELMHD